MAKKVGITLTEAYEAISRDYDVLVVGGGNAALCAAMTARELGASVLLLEKAERTYRGGNSRHTRNSRYMHTSGNDHLTGPYLEDEFWEDLMRVTGGQTTEELARLCIRESNNLGEWMKAHGCMFQPSMRGTLHLSRTNAFFLGGGKALVNGYFATSERLGVDVLYEADVQSFQIEDGVFKSATFMFRGREHTVRAKAVVVASGGFQANLKWLEEYWGDAIHNFLVRGTPYDTGEVLRNLIDNGVQTIGDPKQCHCVAIDARAPKVDGGIVTRLDCLPFSIVVNKDAERFYDEGEDFWPKRYAIWGRLVGLQEGQEAYCIIDSKSINLFMPSVFPPIECQSIDEVAQKLKLDAATLKKTVDEFNAAVVEGGSFDPDNLDGCHTKGLEPAKTNWARRIDIPPFYAYPLRPGITFTYHGVKVDSTSRVLMEDGSTSPNIFAAGEIMSGNVLGKGYMAGFGMTIGSVFGRIAGRGAAYHAKQ